MNILNLKEHNLKTFAFTKKVASGTYPSKKVATVGSYIGLAVGTLLFITGGVGIIIKSLWGVGSALAGVITIASNIINLKRIK